MDFLIAESLNDIRNSSDVFGNAPPGQTLQFPKSRSRRKDTPNVFKEIIGSGEAMRKVSELISRVASYDSTILLAGETGTGKELFAQAVHDLSNRNAKSLIKVNCSALPANLIESEFFGYERGSFTGAFERRIGKFEAASGGTLFLDEIGEMPLDAQAKLLRAIQEKEIERIGGKSVIRTDVRIIAATNRDLYEETRSGRFRLDLFYRLNVFPVTLPPLRDRREDIPALVAYFLEKCAKKFRREICRISEKAMKKLLAYNFPGNVRELENIVERSILLENGNVIRDVQLPVSDAVYSERTAEKPCLKTHEENERDHIIKVLTYTGGKVSGSGGAAEILNLNVSTLKSKIKKLNIKKDYY